MQLKPHVCVIFVLALSACTHYVGDIEFVGLEPATPSMIKDIKYTDFPANDAVGKPFTRKPERLSSGALRLRFRSREDLTKLQGEDYIRVSLCPYHDAPFVSVATVYSDGNELGNLRFPTGTIVSKAWNSGIYVGSVRYDGPSGIHPTNDYFNYEAYITYESQSLFVDDLHTFINVPLPKITPDLCFKIVGTSIPWPAYESNVVTLPAKALEKALELREKTKVAN